jgi:phage head maturation protease
MTEATPTTLVTDAIGGGEVFAVDHEARTIRGRAMPYGVVGVKGGQRFTFSKGAIRYGNPNRVKLYVDHDKTKAVGYMTELIDTDQGLDYVAKIARGPRGDEALMMADDKVWDGNSVGPHEGVKFALRDGVFHAVDYPLREVSLTPQPVFDDARVSAVSMSHHTTKEGSTVTDTTTTDEATAQPANLDFDALSTNLATAIKDGFANLTFPQREVTDPAAAAAASFEVREPSPYRFDGIAGAHSFSDDLRSYASGHDPEARQRIDTFMVEAWESQFAVTAANVSSLNVTKNRPDLFVPNLAYTRPLWDLVTNGVVDDKTPFTIPKFASATGLVGNHTEGVEPTPGAFTATAQTITPVPMSGKVEIVREVWDQGGEPKADAIIWAEMLNGYFEAIEAKIATVLAAVATAEINLASAVDAALVTAMTNVLVDLQFVRGGNRYTALALDGMLGKALVNAKDTAGRNILPVLGPTNAQGQTEPGFDGVQLGNLRGRFAWALGATNASKSYLFVPSSVYAWASAPRKFTFEYRVSAVDLAIWGYSAAAVTRDSDVKPIDYTTADV